MLSPAFRIALSILVFRSGPQDMPYDAGPGLLRACMLFALTVFTVYWSIMAQVPAIPALLLGAVSVASIGFTTRAALSLRKVENRYQQTSTALLLTNAVLTLPMLPMLNIIAPPIVEYWRHILQDANLANHPELWPELPKVPGELALLFELLNLWLLAVYARIYAQAADAGVLGGLLIAVLRLSMLMFSMMLVSPLVKILSD